MTTSLAVIASGDWQRQPQMQDYRAEWLNDMLVERAVWAEDAPAQKVGALTIAAPGYVWFRFWLTEGERILEKYFDQNGRPLGMYARIGMAVPHQGRGFSVLDLILGLWITAETRVTVLNEARFDAAVRDGVLSPVEAEHAEHQIRELTTSIAGKRFPPALVRNFTIAGKWARGEGRGANHQPLPIAFPFGPPQLASLIHQPSTINHSTINHQPSPSTIHHDHNSPLAPRPSP